MNINFLRISPPLSVVPSSRVATVTHPYPSHYSHWQLHLQHPSSKIPTASPLHM